MSRPKSVNKRGWLFRRKHAIPMYNEYSWYYTFNYVDEENSIGDCSFVLNVAAQRIEWHKDLGKGDHKYHDFRKKLINARNAINEYLSITSLTYDEFVDYLSKQPEGVARKHFDINSPTSPSSGEVYYYANLIEPDVSRGFIRLSSCLKVLQLNGYPSDLEVLTQIVRVLDEAIDDLTIFLRGIKEN